MSLEDVTTSDDLSNVDSQDGSVEITEKHNVSDAPPKGSTRVLAEEVNRTDAPKSVYQETTPKGKFLWAHLENSKEVGRVPVVVTNDDTQISVVTGYDYTIKDTPENRKKLLKKANYGTAYYHKRGEHTVMVKKEEF